MRNALKGMIAATALAATGVVATQPAQARDHTGVAVAAGIIGLGIGAAIASSDHPHYSRVDYDGGYPSYGYGYGNGYYGQRYYAQPYYAQPYAYTDGPRGYYRADDRGWDRHHGEDRGHWDRDRHDDRWGR